MNHVHNCPNKTGKQRKWSGYITAFLSMLIIFPRLTKFSLILILLGTAHLGECPRGVVLVDELEDPY